MSTARIGIVGGGQLGRMLALAAAPLGLHCTVLDPAVDAGAAIAAAHIQGDYDDPTALEMLAAKSDVVTFEFENVPAAALTAIATKVTLAPPPQALAVSQDRLAEKQLFKRLSIETAPFIAVESEAEVSAAAKELGSRAILKTRRLGYDGKGQALVESPDDATYAWRAVGSRPSILEEIVAFDRELSVIAVRGTSGETVFYPLTQNRHAGGILRESRAPAVDVSPELDVRACGYASALMDELEYVGAIALELFECDGKLLANELAPRVHNSGHWTIDAAPVSQFENHVRAVLGMPLGTARPARNCVMLNLISAVPDPAKVLAVPGAHLHLYGKTPRHDRKLGHVTITAEDHDLAALEAAVLTMRSIIETAE